MSGWTEYMCTYCGAKRKLSNGSGRPMPGDCPRRRNTANGKTFPHRWIINRKG